MSFWGVSEPQEEVTCFVITPAMCHTGVEFHNPLGAKVTVPPSALTSLCKEAKAKHDDKHNYVDGEGKFCIGYTSKVTYLTADDQLLSMHEVVSTAASAADLVVLELVTETEDEEGKEEQKSDKAGAI